MTWLMILVAAATLLCDLATKALASAWLQGAEVRVIPGLLEWRLTHNQGMALGILSGDRLANLLLPLAVIAGGLFLLRRYQPTRFTRTAAGLILGGFLGNFVQRLARGYVVDMIYFPFMPWFVCNAADIAICAGVGMLVLSVLFRPKDWRERVGCDKADR